MLRLAALDGQVANWLDLFGPILSCAIVWGLVFAGTGLFGDQVGFLLGRRYRRTGGSSARATNAAEKIPVITTAMPRGVRRGLRQAISAPASRVSAATGTLG